PGDDVIARRQQMQHRRGRREPRREREAVRAALERREVGLERVAREVVRARVLEALVHARRRLRVRRAVVDRRHHGAGRRVGRLPGVDRPGAKTKLSCVLHALLRSARYSMRSILVMMPMSWSPSCTTTSLASLKMLRRRTTRVAGDTVA